MAADLENITERPLDEEVSQSFLTYAVSVVTSRAIPSVLDGMKPVVRRCVFGAYNNGYRASKKHVKSARIVGDVMGQLHPHGDSAVYDTIVGLVQPWGNNIPMFDGSGNWGSLGKEDPAAAGRYCVTGDTRVRMADGTTKTLLEIAEAHAVNGPGEANTDLKVLGAEGEPVAADRIFHSGTHPVKTLTTAKGRRLTGTDNHPVLVLEPLGDTGVPALVWKRLDEVEPGDQVTVLRQPADEAGSHTAELDDLALVSGAFVGRSRPEDSLFTDETWTDCVVAAYRRLVGEDVYASVRALLSARPLHARDVRQLAELSESPLADLAREPSNQRVPAWIWAAPRHAKTVFLMHLFEGGGDVRLAGRDSVTVAYSAESEQLALDIQELLLELGIVADRRADNTVAISNRRDVRIFGTTVGFAAAKQDILAAALHWSPEPAAARSDDYVPHLADWILANTPSGDRAQLASRNIDRVESWERDPALRARVPAGVLPLAEKLTRGTYYFDKVESVVDAGEEAVYSLRVATDDHAFITNGIVSHNTEARLTSAAEILCESIDEDSVDMIDNYDATMKEPAVLPASFPNLLVNGTSGIAVGMACNFAPHNLDEITSALTHLLKHPDATVDDLMKHLPGPDFPTGGVLVDDGGIKQAYETGRGRVRLRARTEIEDVSARKRGIVVTELPFTVGPEAVQRKIADLRNAGKLEGVSKVTNFTDRRSGLRLVIEVKAGANPEQVRAQLLKLTPLEQAFNFNQVALVGREPRLMGLIELCEHYLEHRVNVVTRRSKFRLRKAEARAHIVEGYIKAHAHIDEVVKLIKASKTTKTAAEKLRKAFDLSQKQAEAILEMTLRRLTGLEIDALRDELKQLKATIQELKDLIGSRDALKQQVATELKATTKKLSFERRTEIITGIEDSLYVDPVDEPATVEEGPLTLAWDVDGKIFAHSAGTEAERPLRQTFDTTTTATVGVVTDQGTLLSFPALGINGSSYPLSEHVDFPEGEHPVGLVPRTGDGQVVLVTRAGFVKKIDVAQFAKKDGLPIIKMKSDDDTLIAALPLSDDQETLSLVSSEARLLNIELDGVRAQGRTGGGVAGMKLGEAHLVGAGLVRDGVRLATLTDAGSAKSTDATLYPVKGRGGAGVRCHNFKKGETSLVAAAFTSGPSRAASARAVKPVKDLDKRDGSGVKVGITGDLLLGL